MRSIKHLVIITPGFPKDEMDSLCIPPLQIFLKHLSRLRDQFSISVISLQYPVVEKEYVWNGINVFACGGNNQGLLKKILVWKKAVKSFHKVNDKNKVDMIHSFWLTEAALIGNYLAKRKRIPHVITSMGQDVKADNSYLRFIDQKFPKVVALSERQKIVFEKSATRQVDAIIPWGIDSSEFPKSQIEERDIDILGVGSLIQLKDYTTFIEVAHSLSLQYPGLSMTLVGDGPERDLLEQKAKEIGLKINFTGPLERSKVLELMARSKVFLHPSTYESQGFVFNEAAYAGCNIVSRPVGIAQPADYWKLGDTAEKLKLSVEQFLQTDSANCCQQTTSVDQTINEYLRVYG